MIAMGKVDRVGSFVDDPDGSTKFFNTRDDVFDLKQYQDLNDPTMDEAYFSNIAYLLEDEDSICYLPSENFMKKKNDRDMEKRIKNLEDFVDNMNAAENAAVQARIIWNLGPEIRDRLLQENKIPSEEVRAELKKLASARIKTAGASDHVDAPPMSNAEDIQKNYVNLVMGADAYVPEDKEYAKEYRPFLGKMFNAKNIAEQAEAIGGLKSETQSRIMQELRNRNKSNQLDESRKNLLGALEALEALEKLEKTKQATTKATNIAPNINNNPLPNPMPTPTTTPKVEKSNLNKKMESGNASIKQPGAKPGTKLTEDQLNALKKIYSKEPVSYDDDSKSAIVEVKKGVSITVTGEKITIPSGKAFGQADYETMIKAARELYGDELVLQHSDPKELEKMQAAFAAVKKSDLVKYQGLTYKVLESEPAPASTPVPGGPKP